MGKFRADINTGHNHTKSDSSTAAEEAGSDPEEANGCDAKGTDFVATATTIGAVAVVAAVVDVALIPGLALGVAAAFAPRILPKLGERLEPLFNSTVRSAYKLTRKARGAVAEAHERIHDIAAEVDAEEITQADETHATPAAP